MTRHTHHFVDAPVPVRRRPNAAVDIVLLSNDELIYEITRNAIDEQHPVWRTHTTDEALEQLVSGHCGVLVVDLGTTALEAASLVRQVTDQFPDLVVVAAGRQADEGLLGSLISDGRVYRYMHKPLSPKRAGMFLNAALRSHAERREHPGLVDALIPHVTELPPRVERRYWYGAAIGLLAVIAGTWVYLSLRNDTPVDETMTGLLRPEGAGVPPEVLLARATAALEGGRLESPANDNALDLYRDLLLAEPQNTEARAGLDRVSDMLLARAHNESIAGRGDEARRLVRRVLAVDPANSLALAMQARLEVPELIEDAAANADQAPESFMTLLRREFAAATRRQSTPAVAAAAPASRARAASAAPPPVTNPLATGPGATPNQPAPAPLSQPAELMPAPAAAAAAAIATPDAGGSGPALVPLREFTRVSTSQPDYPDDARRAGTEGWVRLEFTVGERGQVRDVVVVGAEPRGVFESAATAAVSRWRFRPPIDPQGRPVPLRTSVQLRFQLQE